MCRATLAWRCLRDVPGNDRRLWSASAYPRAMLKMIALLLCLAPATLMAQTAPAAIKFDPSLWNVEPGAIVSGMSTDVLALRGEMHLKDVAIGDGIVEVDVMATSKIAFAGLGFRADGSD